MNKAQKPCQDSKTGRKESDTIIATEHPNDIIDVTQHDIDSDFPKRLMFGKVFCGSLSNRKTKSKGKTDTYARINLKKGVNDASNRDQKDRAHFLHAILVDMADGGQDDTQKNVSFTIKIFSINSS